MVFFHSAVSDRFLLSNQTLKASKIDSKQKHAGLPNRSGE